MGREQSEWTFGPVSGPLCGGLAALAAAAAQPVLDFPALMPAGLAAVGAGVSAMVGLLRKRPMPLVSFRALAWLGAGAWSTWTIDAGWSWIGGGVLLGGGLVAGMFAPLVAQDPGEDETPRPALRGGVAAQWKTRIDHILSVPAPGVRIAEVEHWPNGTGYDIVGDFPEDSGMSYDNLQAAGVCSRLGASARLKPGCVPMADEGDYQGQFLLRVPTVYDMATEVPYPEVFWERSILDEQEIGRFPDTGPVMIELRQATGLIASKKGGGKTNGMDVVTADLVQCRDVLVWHVDLNGGGMSVPWMVPFVREDLQQSPIDWVAATPDEALIMSQVGLAITKARKAQYGVKTVEADSRLVPISADIPEIVIMIDEAAEVLGETAPSNEMRDNFTEIVRLGRAVGVNLVISSLRAIGDHIPVQVRKSSGLRIGLKVAEDNEYDYLFNYARGLRAKHLREPGSAFIFRDDWPDDVRMFKWFHLRPSRIAEVVRWAEGRRPDLDRSGLKVGGRVYADRWVRLAPWLAELAADDDPLREVLDILNPGDADTVERARRRAVERVERIRQAPDDEVQSAFDELVSRMGLPPRPGAVATMTQPSLDDRKALVTRIVRDAGEDGIMRAAVIDQVRALGVDVADQTVSEWLNAAEADGLVRRGSKKGLWFAVEETV